MDTKKEPHLTHSAVEEIASLLRELCSNSDRLPSFKALALQFGVSVPTVAKAAAKLREEGLIRYSRGRRSRVAGAVLPLESAFPAGVKRDVVFQRIKALCENQTYRAGHILPKIDVLSREHGVSRRTAIRALKSLAEKGLAHRFGRRWVVGPDTQGPRTHTRQSKPAILLLMERKSAWRSLVASMRTGPFCFSFTEEVNRYGAELIPVYTSAIHAPAGFRLAGIDAARSFLADELKGHLLGTVVVVGHRFLDRFDGWFDFLTRQGRPMVCVDPYDIEIPKRPLGKMFVRCHYSERKGLAAALEHFRERGHRRVVVPVLDSTPNGWQMLRLQCLQETALDKGPEILSMLSGRAGPEESIGERLAPMMVEIRKALRSTPALMALNDGHAKEILGRLESSGWLASEELSFLAFDNSAWSQSLRLSSVDWGFASIGYAAFHILFGVIPVPRDRHNDVASKPFVADRGSVRYVAG